MVRSLLLCVVALAAVLAAPAGAGARADTDGDGLPDAGDQGKWRSRKRFHGAHVFARASRSLEPELGRCTATRSRGVHTG
jgi:hypothetical protein